MVFVLVDGCTSATVAAKAAGECSENGQSVWRCPLPVRLWVPGPGRAAHVVRTSWVGKSGIGVKTSIMVVASSVTAE